MSRVLFDEGVPVGVREALDGYTVDTAPEVGWAGLANGELIAAAEQAGYEIFITTDQNIAYQNNLSGRRISLVVLGTTQWPAIRPHLASIRSAVDSAKPGSYVTVPFPRQPRKQRPFTPKGPQS